MIKKTNREKFEALVSGTNSKLLEEIEIRIENRATLRKEARKKAKALANTNEYLFHYVETDPTKIEFKVKAKTKEEAIEKASKQTNGQSNYMFCTKVKKDKQ